MVNHRNILAVESRWRVQLASLSLGEIKQHLNHLHYYVENRLKLGLTQSIALAKHLRGFLNILITTTISQSVARLSPLFTNSLVRLIMTIMYLSQPQFKLWRRFVPHTFECQLVSSRNMEHVVVLHPARYRWCRLHTHLPQFIGR